MSSEQTLKAPKQFSMCMNLRSLHGTFRNTATQHFTALHGFHVKITLVKLQTSEEAGINKQVYLSLIHR